MHRRDGIRVWFIDNHDNFDLLVSLTKHAVDRAQQQFRPSESRYYDRNQHHQFSNNPGVRGTPFARTTISVILGPAIPVTCSPGRPLYTSLSICWSLLSRGSRRISRGFAVFAAFPCGGNRTFCDLGPAHSTTYPRTLVDIQFAVGSRTNGILLLACFSCPLSSSNILLCSSVAVRPRKIDVTRTPLPLTSSRTRLRIALRESGKSEELEERNQNELARYVRMPQNGGQRGCAIEQPVPEVRFNQNDGACERS